MKRNLTYSLLVFALLFIWVIAGGLTQLFMGVLGDDALGFLFGISIGTAVIGAAIFFAAFGAIRKKYFDSTLNTVYTPSKAFIAMAGALLALSLVGSVTQSYSVGKVQAATKQADAKSKNDAAKAFAERQEREKQRLAAMTPEEREADSKRREEAVVAPIIQEGEAMLKRSREREAWATATLAGKKIKEPDSKIVTKQEWADVKTHLNSIKATQPQYQKAQALLTAIADEDKKAVATNNALEATARVEARKGFAKRMEHAFTEKRMDTDVSVSGPKNTVLRIKWILASKVTANDLSKSGILEQAEDAGFKKVNLTDGYDFSWGWELHPKAE
jgi:hypothetical protein